MRSEGWKVGAKRQQHITTTIANILQLVASFLALIPTLIPTLFAICFAHRRLHGPAVHRGVCQVRSHWIEGLRDGRKVRQDPSRCVWERNEAGGLGPVPEEGEIWRGAKNGWSEATAKVLYRLTT